MVYHEDGHSGIKMLTNLPGWQDAKLKNTGPESKVLSSFVFFFKFPIAANTGSRWLGQSSNGHGRAGN